MADASKKPIPRTIFKMDEDEFNPLLKAMKELIAAVESLHVKDEQLLAVECISASLRSSIQYGIRREAGLPLYPPLGRGEDRLPLDPTGFWSFEEKKC